MPGNARKDIVREGEVGVYHVWSRCVQRAFLCGNDPLSGCDYSYRRDWLESLLEYQASVFALDVGNYAILSNHNHAILRTRPDIADTWTDEEVAWRWKRAWPKWDGKKWSREPKDAAIRLLLGNQEKLDQARFNLSSLSWFMARWKEPVARLANAEMGTKGHFWEARFGSRELVGDEDVLACSIYVDLNQCKAGMAASLDQSTGSAIQRRIESWSAEQVAGSLAKFEKSAHEDQILDEAVMRALLADCFLAPIKTEAPLMTGWAKTAAATTPPNARSDGRSPNKPKSKSKSKTKGKKRTNVLTSKLGSKEIHRRLAKRRRARASDNLFLPMSIEQYMRTAKWALSKWRAKQQGEFDSEASNRSAVSTAVDPAPLAAGRTDPDNWRRDVTQFQNWFRRHVQSDASSQDRSDNIGDFLHGEEGRETFP